MREVRSRPAADPSDEVKQRGGGSPPVRGCGPSLRTCSSASPLCPSDVALLLPVRVEAGAGRGDGVQVAPGLAQEHGWHLGEPQSLANPPPLPRDALEAQPDQGARGALAGADVAAREFHHRPQPDAVETLDVLAEAAAVADLAAPVTELGGSALQLEAVDHPALAVLDRHCLPGLVLRTQQPLAELGKQRLRLVVLEMPNPGLGVSR